MGALLAAAGLLAALLCGTSSGAHAPERSPIRWAEYSEEAFARARAQNKPVFLVISASWCYICQVYEAGALSRPDVAEYLNRHYVPVFIDWDRRRDVARAYPSAGIPVTAVLAPDGELLVTVPGVIPADRLLASLHETVRLLGEGRGPSSPPRESPPLRLKAEPDRELLEGYLERFETAMERSFDRVFGGFGLAQKEPHAAVLLRLLDLHAAGDPRWRQPLENTLRHMLGRGRLREVGPRPALDELLRLRERQAEFPEAVDELQTRHPIAGILDPAEGGFFRYASRRDWSAPHFEKLLFDNAELLELFAVACRALGADEHCDAARRTARYLLDTLCDREQGRFLGSQAADGVYYHLSAEERRGVRRPPVDRTTYAAPSARAVIALLGAAENLGDPTLREEALRGLSFLETRMTGSNGVLSFFDPDREEALLDGQLRDNAWVALAHLRAFEATREPRRLEHAEGVLGFLTARLYDPESGGFFARRVASENFYRKADLGSRDKPLAENGVAAEALQAAYRHTGNDDYLRAARYTAGFLLSQVASGDLEASSPELHRVARELLVSGREGAGAPEVPRPEGARPSNALPLAGIGVHVLALLAFAAGVLSFLSPCTLPILPAYFAFALRSDRRTILGRTAAFALGLSTGFSALGATATAIGSVLGAHRALAERAGGVALALFGLASILGKGFTGVRFRERPAAGLLGSFLFGLAFSVGWSTCIGPILGGVLVLAATRGHALSGAGLLFAFSAGLCIPLVTLSLGLQRLDREALLWRLLRGRGWDLRLGRTTFHLHTTGLASGVLFFGLGVLMATGHLSVLNRVLPLGLQAWFAGLEDALLGRVGR